MDLGERGRSLRNCASNPAGRPHRLFDNPERFRLHDAEEAREVESAFDLGSPLESGEGVAVDHVGLVARHISDAPPCGSRRKQKGLWDAGFLKPTPNRIWFVRVLHQAQQAGGFAHFIQDGFEPSDRLFRSKSHINPLIFNKKQAFWSRRHDGGLVPTASLRSTPFCAAILG